jgi:hypothetical protein
MPNERRTPPPYYRFPADGKPIWILRGLRNRPLSIISQNLPSWWARFWARLILGWRWELYMDWKGPPTVKEWLEEYAK